MGLITCITCTTSITQKKYYSGMKKEGLITCTTSITLITGIIGGKFRVGLVTCITCITRITIKK